MVRIEKLPNRKALLKNPAVTVVIDVSEQPIERAVKNQKVYFSEKKRYKIEIQFVICLLTMAILSVLMGKGK
ncbi:hypothetical protein [Methylobacter sp. S3L5C]|uniref:hypothetical protein n=1 Tax=Methylobacter sp. S3L5C TaxID=2839024 RepID=UPI001FAD29C3|nr:hypothetical protein [Methylobacter sp. S3L5C]